ncbi:MAG TPA: protein kinase [Polyangiaceae bacterium]|nr:protein kinase [Polyangiaceae bacterium]
MGESRCPGDVVGRYRIVRVLGHGRTGTTYEAQPIDAEDGAHVAVKELRLSRVDDWKVVELFEREARVLAQITHPAVPAYVDYFSVEDPAGSAFCLVQQLAPGRSLHDLVASGWRADEAEAKRIARAILDVLDYLHARRPPVYHRDIKPKNIVREESGKIWLVDFGAVRDVYRSITVGGSTVAGTFGYMAPEQLHGVARPESDLFGLAATLVTLLSGQSPVEMPQRKLKTEFRSHVRVSRPFADWLETMIEPAPEDRFPSAYRSLEALRDPPPTPLPQRVRATTLALFAILLVTILGAGGFAFHEVRASLLSRLGARHAGAAGAPSKGALPDRPQHWSFPAVVFERNIPVAFNAVMSAAFTPDGTRLVTGSFDETARILDARSGRFLAALPGHTTRIGAVRVFADGQSVLTAGDRTLRLWSLPDGKPIRTIDVGESQVFGADVAPSGTMLASGTSGGLAKIWTVDGTLIRTLVHGGSRVFAVAFTLDGSRLATAGDDGTVRVWNVNDGSLTCTLAGHTAGIGSFALAPDGQLLASASDDHTVKLWHLQSCRLISTLSLHTDEAWSVAFSPDGSTLVTGGKDAVLGVWSLPTATLRQRVDLGAGAKGTLGIAFAPNPLGDTFVTAHGAGGVWRWHLARSGGHVLPSPVIEERSIPATATHEQREYSEAMDLIESYSGNPAPLHEAQARLLRLLDDNPRSALALAGLGRIAIKQALIVGDKYDGAKLATAVGYADRAIAAEPGFADGYIVRGWAAHQQKDGLAARTALRTALKLAPTSSRALSLAVDLDIGDGDWDAAEKRLFAMLSGSINHRLAAGAFEDLANIYEHIGDLDAADQARRRQIDLEPDSAWAKGDYAQFLGKRGDWAGDIVWVQKALAQLPYGVAKRTLAEAYCATGEQLLWEHSDPDGAVSAFQGAAGIDPGASCAPYGLGACSQFTGSTQQSITKLLEARTWYAKAVALDPKNILAQKALSGT